MIKYGDLVKYIKENHVNWNEDLFDVLRGFFESLGSKEYQQPPAPLSFCSPAQEELVFEHREFQAPKDGEYTTEDLLNLFST